MAEVYGEKPKVFTKEWWPYFWLYYKWHTIAFVFIAMLALIGITDCAKREKYDLGITYLGRTYYEDAMWKKAETLLEPEIKDADANNEKNIGIMQLIVSDKKEYAEQNYATYIKHDTTLADEVSYIYIYDSSELKTISANGFVAENYAEASQWLDGEISDDMLVYDGEKAYAVSLKDSTVLKEAGINCEDLYVLVKYDADLPEKNDAAHDNAQIIANNLIK